MSIKNDVIKTRIKSCISWIICLTLMYYYANPQYSVIKHSTLKILVWTYWIFVISIPALSIPLVLYIRREIIVANKEVLLMFQHANIIINNFLNSVIRYSGRIIALILAYLSGDVLLIALVILAIIFNVILHFTVRATYKDWI